MMFEKMGPAHESKRAPARFRLLQDVGPRDVRRHQVGRELDSFKADVKNPGDRTDHQGLGQPGHADQQHMAPSKDCRQDQLDHVMLTDDHLTDLGSHDVA